MRKLCFSLLTAILAVLMLTAVALADNAETTKTIRVGYVDDYGIINSPVVSGSEGYGYEYLNTIIEYTQGNYTLEFVQCTWDNLSTKLQSGEIDIFAPCGYTDKLASQFIYNQCDLGHNTLFLTSIGNETIDTSTYNKLNGSKIGIPSTDYDGSYIQGFLTEYEVQATVIILPSEEDYDTVFQEYSLDYYIVSALQLPATDNFNILAQIKVEPLYCIAMPENQALLDDIDYGIRQIEAREYMYQEKLFLKYYDYDITANHYISSEEYDILQSQDVYRVGLENLHSPFVRIDDNGEFSGVAVDFLELVSDYANLKFELIEVDDSTSRAVINSIDFYMFPTDYDSSAKQSISYLDAPLILIDHSSTIDSVRSVGILSYYGLQITQADGTLLNREVTVFDSLTDMRKAFDAGDIESMILTTASLNYIRRDIEDSGFLSTSLDNYMEMGLIYTSNVSQEQIAVLNKVITNLDDTDLDYILLKNSSATVNSDFFSLVYDNPFLLVGFLLFFFLMFVFSEGHKRRALSQQINYDSLTGLYSQHKFSEEAKILCASHPNVDYQLIALDIDNFKYVNEIYGYTTGTLILKKLSEIIKECLPEDALFARSYSDNFLIFIPKTNLDDNFEHYLIHAPVLNRELSRILGTSYHFSFCIGIYDVPHAQMDMSYMIDCANLAREMGKKTSGTTFHKFSEVVNLERARNNEIVASMERALTSGQFILHYQSKISLHTGELVGAEALVRWQKDGKLVPPFQFIPLFEKNGFIRRLDFCVLEMVCQFLHRNADKNIPKISVNLSGITVAVPDVVPNIAKILETYDISPRQIDIEITETAFVGTSVAAETVTQLESMGFSISMDDFGAGISSLNRLKNLQIDTLKIDREFIVDYLGNQKGTTILKSVLSMANSLGIETVAEGIETWEQMENLRLYGCDIGQGYYFSRPIDEASFLKKYF